MELKSKKEYEDSTGIKQKEYILKEVLESEDDVVLGKIKAGPISNINFGDIIFFRVDLYDIYGNKKEILKEQPPSWGIPIYSDEREGLEVGQYIVGKLSGNGRWAHITDVHILKTFNELKKELTLLLNAKWDKEGFKFTARDIVKFDGTAAMFDEWLVEKVVGKIENKYEASIYARCDKQKQKLDDIDKSIKERKTELENLAAEKTAKDNELKVINERKKEVEELYKKYTKWGIIREHPSEIKLEETYPYSSFSEMVEDVWKYLWVKKNLYYEKETVQYFMNALRTNQLILLWGSPGTGKTSLPDAVAEALQAECVRIQVQSNWTDNQDLLGFYNIIDKRYVATRFMDALVKAGKNPEKLYLILLDEMNLTNVEYYFSEMLNVFTEKGKYEVQLYSKKIFDDVKKALEEAETQKKDTTKLEAQRADIEDYPPIFEIPDNVRFIGTLNMDDTTKMISPKVIDRSCCIELQMLSKEKRQQGKAALQNEKNLKLDGENIRVFANKFEVREAENDDKITDRIDTIREILKKTGVSISNRVNLYINRWRGWKDDTKWSWDEVVLEKILPCINIEKNNKNKTCIEELENELKTWGNCNKSLTKLHEMMEKDEEFIKYWEK